MQSEIEKLHNQLCELTIKEKTIDALTLLRAMIEKGEDQQFFPHLEALEQNYQNILHYSYKGVKDPEQNKIINFVLRNILSLADKVKEQLLTQKSKKHLYQIKWSINKTSANEIEYLEKRLKSIVADTTLENIINTQKQEPLIDRQTAIEDLFLYLWLSDEFHEKDLQAIHTIIDSPSLPWHDKSLFVSAITLSLFRNFTLQKIEYLIAFINGYEHQVWERALVGLMLSLYLYKDRLHLYPEIKTQLQEIKDKHLNDNILEALLLQIIKAQDTERLTKKWEEEILPEVMKMQSTIEQKLDLENIVQDNFLEDKNPDWEEVFGDSPELLDKLQQFSEMQLEGSDVFMGTFSRLKNFPFFNEISNWFVPFYAEHPEVKELFVEGEMNLGLLFEKLGETRFMCNSDKYSFCLNIKNIPSSHRQQMTNMFQAEMEQMKDISTEADTLDPLSKSKSVITQYMQDLYRFFKLYSHKSDFIDPFAQSLDIINTNFYKSLAEAPGKLKKKVAEFYFEKERYPEAILLFKEFEPEVTESSELFEKIAYAYQRQGKYREALDYYKKAELLNPNKVWITKKIALCFRYIGEHKQALQYYKEAEKLAPEDLYTQAYIGHTLFHLRHLEEALKYYFKVEYLAPSNQKIRRPIAYISLLLGKFETAENYYHKLLEDANSQLDQLHLGHVYLCDGQRQKAIDTYLQSAKRFKNVKHFRNAFEEDREVLINNNIVDREVNLILDIIQNKLAG